MESALLVNSSSPVEGLRRTSYVGLFFWQTRSQSTGLGLHMHSPNSWLNSPVSGGSSVAHSALQLSLALFGSTQPRLKASRSCPVVQRISTCEIQKMKLLFY